MKKIHVVDSIMGSGKTSWAIQYMKTAPGPFLYVTPFKEEVKRILSSCVDQEFVQPEIEEEFSLDQEKVSRSKSNGLRLLLERGENVATTHALFRLFDKEMVRLIELHGYKLILDEVMDVLDVVGLKGDSPSKMIEHGIVVPEPNPKHPSCVRLLPGPKELAKYADIRRYAEQGRLVGVFDTMLLWLFPADVFEAFEEVWNLTYLFDGQDQRAFFDLFSLEYERRSVVKNSSGEYVLVPHDPEHDRPFIEQARELIRLYEGPRNNMGKMRGKSSALSAGWWDDRKGKQGEKRRELMAATRSWLKKTCKATVGTTIWTVFKDVVEKGLFPEDFLGSFIPLNTRATNLYRDRDNVAYLINKFFNPNLVGFFRAVGVFSNAQEKVLMEELHALSEMIQFIWRSAIREGKPINLFVPSERMRNLLMDWLNFNIGNLEDPVKTAPFEG